MTRRLPLPTAFMILLPGLLAAQEAEKKLKVFILAGQSNMVGWGDSAKLPEELRSGGDRVLMFENGKWQPLKPTRKATKSQERFGMTYDVYTPTRQFRLEDEIVFRTYTYDQFEDLVRRTRAFRIAEAYDFGYDIDDPIEIGPATQDVVFILERK